MRTATLATVATFALAMAAAGCSSDKTSGPTSNDVAPSAQDRATLQGELQQLATQVGTGNAQASAALQGSALAIQLIDKVTNVSVSGTLRRVPNGGVNADLVGAAAAAGTGFQAYGFQATLIHAPPTGNGQLVVSGVLAYALGAKIILTAGVPPGGPFGATAAGLLVNLPSAAWLASAGNTSSTAGQSTGACVGAPSFVTSCLFAPFQAGFNISGSAPAPISGNTATGSQQATLAQGTLRGVIITIDCALTTLCGQSASNLSIAIVSGGNQTGKEVAKQADPMVVKVSDSQNHPAANATITWTHSGGGTLGHASTTSGNDGTSSNTFILGTTAGPQSVTASVGGSSVTFQIASVAGPASLLKKASVDSASVASGSSVTIKALATDIYSNPKAGVAVTFAVQSGGGSVNPSAPVTTGADGIATAQWTVGATSGTTNNANATAPGLNQVMFSTKTVAATLSFASIWSGPVASATCGLLGDGTAYCWGGNIDGQTALGVDTNFATRPTKVPGGIHFTQMALGQSANCGLDINGTAYCWGIAQYIGVNDTSVVKRYLVPTAVSTALKFTSIASGFTSICGVSTAGDAYCWGQSAYGAIGSGDANTPASAAPVPVPQLVVGNHKYKKIVGSAGVFCGILSTATPGTSGVLCWGGEYANLGNGSQTRIGTPTLVSGSVQFVDVAMNTQSACALDAAQHEYCWGANANGELGDGTTSQHLEPVPVTGGNSFASISGNCALTAAGDAMCWGYNGNGIDGIGSVDNNPHTAPAAVVGGLKFSSLTWSGAAVCGLQKGTGHAYCWGQTQFLGAFSQQLYEPSPLPVLGP